MTLATVHELHRRKPVSQGCLCKDENGPCRRPATWSLKIACSGCGMHGNGPACSWHKVQADEWGVPHRRPDMSACPTNAVIEAVPLGRVPR